MRCHLEDDFSTHLIAISEGNSLSWVRSKIMKFNTKVLNFIDFRFLEDLFIIEAFQLRLG